MNLSSYFVKFQFVVIYKQIEFQICKKVNVDGWTVVRDANKRMGPYAYGGDEWVSFDDIDTIKQKTEYLKSMGLGGAMIWALDLDDFGEHCGTGETYPLLKTLNRGLGLLKDGKSSVKHALQSRRYNYITKYFTNRF